MPRSRDACCFCMRLLIVSIRSFGGRLSRSARWPDGSVRWALLDFAVDAEPREDVELEIRRDFTAHVFSLSPSFFDRRKVGDLMALATNDLNAIRMLLGPGIMYVANTAVTLTVVLALMVTLSPKLTLVALLPLPLLAFAVQQGSRLTYVRYAKVQEQFGAVNSIAQEALSACRPMVQGVYIMPPFGRIDAALRVLEAAR